MNNGYNFNFPPNYGFIRNVPMTPNYIAPTPRIGSILGRSTATANTSKITFSSILNGASKTLGVINQAIPVVYQVKPIWNNAKTMFKVVKGLNSNSNDIQKDKKSIPETKKEQINAPTFFD